MDKSLSFFLSGLLGAIAQGALAQDVPPGPPPLQQPVQMFQERRMEQRMERREEMRERRDAWRQMSPEERHQFRSDIRDAGRSIYSRRNRRD